MKKKNCGGGGINCKNACISFTYTCRHLMSGQSNGHKMATSMAKDITRISVDQDLQELAEEFRASHDLDENNTDEAVAHDLIHALSGLGPTLEDERIVLNVQNSLTGGEVDPEVADRVASILSIIPPDYIVRLSDLMLRLEM